jgi:DNA-binding transcriptional LysR family regulator
MDRLSAARVFLTVAECGSLTQAADRLEMSTAMVSRYLAAMEGWLGARLFHRTTRRVSLSEAGHQALPACRQMLQLADELQVQAQEATRVPSGRLQITCASSLAEAQLAPALMQFQQQHPQVSFSVLASDRSIDLAADRIDLAIRITNHLEPGLIARRLAQCHSAICASPEYLRQHGTPQSLDDLNQHRCITHTLVGAAQFHFQEEGRIHKLALAESFSTNETAVLARMVKEGGGIGILPTYYVSEDLRQGRLVRVLPQHRPTPMGIHAVFLSRQHQPLALRLLVDFLAQRFGGDEAVWDKGLGEDGVAPR